MQVRNPVSDRAYCTTMDTSEDTGDSRPPVPVLETAACSVAPLAIPWADGWKSIDVVELATSMCAGEPTVLSGAVL